jgi:hypothetical protein
MDQPQTWAEALNISSDQLSDWSAQVPEGIPLLVWCLEQRHVSVAAYLEWACDHFGLPVLSPEFLTRGFDRQVLQAQASHGHWTPWCFPVGQWEEVTYIACVEPPHEMPEGVFALLLTDPKPLLKIWESEHPSTAILKEEKAPTPTPARSTTPTRMAAAPSPTPEEPSTAAPIEFDAPVGIKINPTKTFVLNLDDMNLGETSTHAAEPPPKSPPEFTEKTSLTFTKTIQSPVLETSDFSSVGLTSPSAPPPLNVAKSDKKTFVLPQVQPSADEEGEIHAAFENLKSDYQSALIMKCSDTTAKPYKWDSAISLEINQSAVNLSHPSFFRIVSKTLQPYHGYVIDSPIHREFFSSLKISEPPACVTAIPLKVDNRLWGILVAFGDENSQGSGPLDRAIKICDKLVGALNPTWTKAA